jgi:hypothetical protein
MTPILSIHLSASQPLTSESNIGEAQHYVSDWFVENSVAAIKRIHTCIGLQRTHKCRLFSPRIARAETMRIFRALKLKVSPPTL